MPHADHQPISQRVIVRFGTTLIANLLRTGLSFVSGLLVARGLGASHYGDVFFLLGSFTAISHLFEMGSSSAFFTFVSRRRYGLKFLVLYLGWLVGQFAVTGLVIGLVLPHELIQRIWVGHERATILLACGASFFMTQVWGMVSQLGEAIRKTVMIQVAATGQALLHLVLVAAAALGGWLTVHTVLWLMVGEYLLLAVTIGPSMARAYLTGEREGRQERHTVAREFLAYCKPLVVYSWVGFLYAFADRWLLQQFGGAAQQGFFAVAQQFANVSLIATTSILRVFWKEIAEASQQQDRQRICRLYSATSRMLYAAGAWLSCLLIPYSREILTWTVGPGYDAGWLPMSIMLLYPVHQSLGQINGTYFYATGETVRHTRIGLLMMALSFPVTYVLLAPLAGWAPGLGLGAIGLALKMVMLQFIGVNLQVHVIARANGWAPGYGYQLVVLGSFLSWGWICKGVSRALMGLVGSADMTIGVAVVGSVLYIGSSAATVYQVPSCVGFTRTELVRTFGGMVRSLRPAASG